MDSALSFLLDKSTDFFCVLDKNGIIKRTNAAFRKALGYSDAELSGKPISSISHPADIRRREDLLKVLFVKKEISGFESRLKAIDGRYYNINWSLIYNPVDGLIYATGTNLTNKLNGTDHIHLTDNLRHIIQSFNEGFIIIDNTWKIISFNPAFQSITGLKTRQLNNANFKNLHTLGLTDEVLSEFETAFNENVSAQLQYFNAYSNRWYRVNIYPYKNEVMVFVRDITSLKTQQLILSLEKDILEMNASGSHSLQSTINEFLKGVEAIFPEMISSVLEADEAQEKLHHLAGPRLPEAYCNAINGTLIGPKSGSCGTAAFHRSQVIVSDIATDPLWDDFRHLILPYGIKACWSTPIISSHSAKVLATFAIYYTTQREPKEEELHLIERTSSILRVLIENKKNLDHVNQQNERLQEIASISSHEIRRPVATILGLVNLFDITNLQSPINTEIINHLHITAQELDSVIHTIVEKTIYLKTEF